MGDASDDRVYYVISDLHIGGDEQLQEVDYKPELLAFLDDLATRDESAELIINGDAFGLWEFTTIDGLEKFDELVETYPELFDQLRETGESVPITLIPGNHDHELAAYDGYVDRFAAYNVNLVQAQSIERPIGEHVIHFEHGHQHDSNNRIENWGDPHAAPLGYYYNTEVTSRAGQLSDRGRFNWLRDVQAVTPTEWMPRWLLSKYFYREMNPWMRYALVPFLLLFNLSALLAILIGLHIAGVITMPVDRTTAYLGELGVAGSAAWWLLLINISVAGLFLLVGIPLYLIKRDIEQTIDRFGLFDSELTVDPEAPYGEAASEIFSERPETVIYCYGHTHRPGVTEVDGRLLVNSGTWLKRLHRRTGPIGILPAVFYPSFQLSAVRISETEAGVVVDYEQIEKPSPKTDELTLTERLLTIGRKPNPTLPDRTVVPVTATGHEVDADEPDEDRPFSALETSIKSDS